MKDIAQGARVFWSEIVHAADVPSAADQQLKRPDRPKRHHGNEAFVLQDDTHLLAGFQTDVIAKQAPAVRFQVRALRAQLFCGFLRN